jgi:alkylation response protein AidB-like acyl-CoA dehydrogenase
VERKLGLHASPTCTLNFGDNDACIGYLNALAYTKGRIQGVDLVGRKPGYVPIIDHPDVRRMLLWMKAMVDGMRSMIYTGAYWSDLAMEMSKRSKTDPLQWASYTYPALLCFGDVTMAWRLLDMAVIAQHAIDEGRGTEFHRGKILQASYFTGVTLPLTMARLETCLRQEREVVEMPEKAF